MSCLRAGQPTIRRPVSLGRYKMQGTWDGLSADAIQLATALGMVVASNDTAVTPILKASVTGRWTFVCTLWNIGLARLPLPAETRLRFRYKRSRAQRRSSKGRTARWTLAGGHRCSQHTRPARCVLNGRRCHRLRSGVPATWRARRGGAIDRGPSKLDAVSSWWQNNMFVCSPVASSPVTTRSHTASATQ
jgi:hypothetical protein